MTGLPLNIDFHQILLHLLNFAILFFIIFFLIYKPVKKFMDKRKQEYLDADAKAENTVKQAEALKLQYEAKLASASDIVTQMKAEAESEISEKKLKAEQESARMAKAVLDKARTDAFNEQERILNETGDKVKEIAKDAARKVLFDNPSDAYDSFLDSAEGKKYNE